MSQFSPIEFTVNQPLDADQRAEHVRLALQRGLRDFDDVPIWQVTILANGPSLRECPADVFRGPTAAVNGALRWCLDQGHAPAYWACCDPQEHVKDFIPDDAPKSTTYLIASKCHPAVFDRALSLGLDVRLWHIRDCDLVRERRPVRVASTVTLTLLSLFRNVGYRHFEVYGWDACYQGDRHHAIEQIAPDPASNVTIAVGPRIDQEGAIIPGTGREFSTTHSWALEARDAVIQLHHADYSVTIHGDGLIKAVTGR